MELIRNKWKNYTAYRKLESLWAEYRKVVKQPSEFETMERFKRFLEQAKKLVQECNNDKNENHKLLNDILGDTSELILSTMFDYMMTFNKAATAVQQGGADEEEVAQTRLLYEIVTLSLELVDFMVQESKYQQQLTNSQQLLITFLALVDLMESSDAKITVIRLLVMTAENVDTKMEFVKQDGFNTLLRLLVSKDENVQRVVSRALLHFLQIDSGDQSKVFKEMKAQLDKNERNSIKHKIQQIAIDFRKFAMIEIERLFRHGQEQETPKKASTSQLYLLDEQLNSRKNENNALLLAAAGRPTYRDLLEADLLVYIAMQADDSRTDQTIGEDELDDSKIVEQLESVPKMKSHSLNMLQEQQLSKQCFAQFCEDDNKQPRIMSSELKDQQTQQQHQQQTPPLLFNSGGNANNLQGQFNPFVQQNNNIFVQQQQPFQLHVDCSSGGREQQKQEEKFKQFMILEGGFKAILNTLMKANQDLQLNLMSTIQGLLSNDKYKIEFKKVNGYEQLDQMFNEDRNYENEMTREFMNKLFGTLVQIIYNDKDSENIINHDAFQLLLNFISNSSSYEVISRALDSLSQIIQSNWKNILIAKRLLTVKNLAVLLLRVLCANSLFDQQQQVVFEGLEQFIINKKQIFLYQLCEDFKHKQQQQQQQLQQQQQQQQLQQQQQSNSTKTSASNSMTSNTSGQAQVPQLQGPVALQQQQMQLQGDKNLRGSDSSGSDPPLMRKGGSGVRITEGVNSQGSSNTLLLKRIMISEKAKVMLLEKVDDIIKQFNVVEGIFSLEAEALFSEIVLRLLVGPAENKQAAIYFFDLLFEMIERKLLNCCQTISTLDDNFEKLTSNLENLLNILKQKVLQLPQQQQQLHAEQNITAPLQSGSSSKKDGITLLLQQQQQLQQQQPKEQQLQQQQQQQKCSIILTEQEACHYLGKILSVLEHFLVCDHQKARERELQESKSQKNSNTENSLVKYIITYNICVNSKKRLLDRFSQNSISAVDQVKTLMLMIREEEYLFSYNVKVLQVAKCFLLYSPEKLMDLLGQDEFSLFSFLAKKILQSDITNPLFEQTCFIFLDIALNLNNSNQILIEMCAQPGSQASILPSTSQQQITNQQTTGQQQQQHNLELQQPLTQPQQQLQQPQQLLFDPKKVGALNAMICALTNVYLKDENNLFFEQLQRLLLQPVDNFKTFRSEPHSMIFITEMLNSVGASSAKLINLYTQILSLLNLFIGKASSEELDLIMDFFFNLEKLEQFKKHCARQDSGRLSVPQQGGSSAIAMQIDIISLLGIHVLLNSNRELLEKVVGSGSGEYLLNIFGFVEIGDAVLQETALKFIIASLTMFQKLKKKEHYAKKNNFYALLLQLLEQSHLPYSENLCKILYDFIFWRPENISLLYPSNSSVVSTLLNRSEFADQIMKTQKSYQESKTPIMPIANPDILEVFLAVLVKYQDSEDNKNFQYEMLKVLESQMDESNINILLETNFLTWFYNYVKQSSLNQQTLQQQQIPLQQQQQYSPSITQQQQIQMQTQSLQLQHSYSSTTPLQLTPVKQNSNGNISSNSQMIVTENLSDQPPQQQSQQLQQQQQPQTPAFTLCNQKIYDILECIMMIDFKKKSGKLIELLKKFCEDQSFIIAILKKFLQKVIENPVMKDNSAAMNFLKNFANLIQSVDDLVGMIPEVYILILQCINRITSKNSGATRAQMKSLGIFDLRDNLILHTLRFDLDSQTLLNNLEGISFESLSSNAKFRDMHVMSLILKILLEKKDNDQSLQNLQIVIIKIIKHDIAVSEENQKYIAKLLENSQIISFFYPELLKKKASSIAKCLNSKKNQPQDDDEDSSDSEDPEANNNNEEQKEGAGSSASKDNSKGEVAAIGGNGGSQNSSKIQIQQKTPSGAQQQGGSNIIQSSQQKKKQQSQTQKKKQLGPGCSVEEFLKFFHSEEWDSERKQILLRINQTLFPIYTEKSKQENKYNQKIEGRRQKIQEQIQSEMATVKKVVNDYQIKINKLLTKSSLGYRQRHQKFIEYIDSRQASGEAAFNKIITAKK